MSMSIPDRLKELRANKSMTQRELANQLNISSSSIAMYETGQRMPDAEVLELFADYFNVTVDYLLGRTDNPFPVDTLAAHKTDGYDDSLTPEEQAAVRAFIQTYRKQLIKDKNE